MDDRELLEAAARAAGMSGTTVDYDDRLVFLEDGKPASIEWNPLTDDGDALRLAVKLRLDILPGESSVLAFRSINHPHRVQAEEESTQDPYAATRRAIVRAAAAITSQEPQ